MQYGEDGWFADTGATNHVTYQREVFKKFKEFSETRVVQIANGAKIEAIGKGTVAMMSQVEVREEPILMTNVWYVPGLKKNLFSVLAALDVGERTTFESTGTKCLLKAKGQVLAVGKRKKNGGLFKLNFKPVYQPHVDVCTTAGSKNLLQLYHERLGHQNKKHVRNVIQRELHVKLPMDTEVCEGCIYGKAHRLKFGKRIAATTTGELIHSDVCGPFLLSLSGFRYFVLFKDDFSGFRFTYFLRKKSEVCDKLKLFIKETMASGYNIKEIRCDNGGEFDNGNVKRILGSYGIKLLLTMPYTPQQNGKSERENRTIVEMARSLMHARDNIIPQGLWAELINTATYILNRTAPTCVEGKSPFELWHKKKPRIRHLRVIGSICYPHIPNKCRRKMDKKANKGILIGYDGDDGYRIWCRYKNKIIRSRDVIFREPKTPITPRPEFRLQQNFQEEMEDGVEKPHPVEEEAESVASATGDEEEDEVSEQPSHMILRDRNNLRMPQRFEDYVMLAALDTDDGEEPSSYQEAVQGHQKEQWLRAMDSEITSLKENKTWVLQELPPSRKAIPCKWVYKIKRNPDGTVDKFKARLVVKGCAQKEGADYNQVFSPVVRLTTIRSVLAVAARERLKLTQFDVSTAFLYGYLDEEIYIRQPEGFSDNTNRVCKLEKSLYGLKQAPRCWNKRFENYLRELGFVKNEADPCLFKKELEGRKIIVALYVDDGLIASTTAEDSKILLGKLQREFKITFKDQDLYYLGLQIKTETEGEIIINQEAYIKRLLKRFDMEDCKPVSTPVTKENIEDVNEQKVCDPQIPYRQAVGALMYLMVSTRPDIAFAVGLASRKLENYTEEDWKKVKRIIRYLKGTINLSLVFKPNNHSLECFSDADHGGDMATGRSTTGILCILAGGAVSWMSQRQTSVAISTTEAELVAASEACREIIWLQRLLNGIIELNEIPNLHVDNEAAIRLAQNPELHKRTKHIRTRHFFIREQVQEGSMLVKHISSNFQLADIFTKVLSRDKFKENRSKLGLRNI